MDMDGVASMFERLLHHLEESATTLLQFAVLPVLKILVLCSFGLGLASPRINILPAASRKILSKVNFRYNSPQFLIEMPQFIVTVMAIPYSEVSFG